MQFENAFDVPLPPRDAWRTLLDIQRVVPCVPGAELTEVIDDKTYKGKVSVRLGPVSLIFAGTVIFEEMDEQKYFVRASARGADAKGRGGADAKVQFRLEPIPEGSRVVVDTTLNLTGSVAQYGRASGVIRGVANQITSEFAKNLKAQINAAAPVSNAAQIAGADAAPAAVAPPTVKPISAFGLLMNLLRTWLGGLFGAAGSDAKKS